MGYNYKQLNFQFPFLFHVHSLGLVSLLPLSVPTGPCHQRERGAVADSLFPHLAICVFSCIFPIVVSGPSKVKKWEKMREENGQGKFLLDIVFWMIVMLSELWKHFKLTQPRATLSYVLRRDLYCLTSQSCSSLDADDKLPTGWLLGGALPHRPSLCWVSVDPLGQNSFNEFPAGFFFYECNLPLEYSSLALSSGLQVPNWYFPPRWNYNSTNLLTFKFPEHKLDHCMCQSNSPSVLWSPFSLVLRWTVGILSFFHSGMGLTAHQLSLLRNSLLTIRFLTLFIPLTWGGGGKILLWSIVYFII